MKKTPLTLPILITRGLPVFPENLESIDAGRDFSIEAINLSRTETNSLLIITCQKDPDLDQGLALKDIYEDASLCRIVKFDVYGSDYKIRVVGSRRVKITDIKLDKGAYYATAETIDDVLEDEGKARTLIHSIVETVTNVPSIMRRFPKSVLDLFKDPGLSPARFSDALGSSLPLPLPERIALLGEPDVVKRLMTVKEAVQAMKTERDIDAEIEETVRQRAEKNQRDYYLQEKMRAIKEELGEGKGGQDSEDEIRQKIRDNPYPENVKAKVEKELARAKTMPESSLEASLIFNYIDVIMGVPWYQETEDNDDLENVRKTLDEDHFGLVKVKERIVEYLAVKSKTKSLRAPIICFYGPPGCGKTSLGRSIARALGRKFYKASLGGVSDESEIRGHRRTYVGSMPGRIIQGMTRAGTRNPVFLLDEIDKVGQNSYKGDTASALLEVLDPEQNFAFNDTYLEEPYDLSHVLFIATANNIENIPGPLRDRLELIEVPSYTEPEKIRIALDFLVRKERDMNGLKEGEISFTEGAIKEIIEKYTREAGVRELSRLIASVARKAVVQLLGNPNLETPIVIDDKKVNELLGVPIFEDTHKEKAPSVGVVTGLAYTSFGGDILPIEVNHFKGKGRLVLTGKLGDVMKESCSIALDYVRANSEKYGIDPDIFESNDIHIHVPEGAVPKDGPSAGVAITTAIVSALTGKKVDNNVAMTGEVTLRGHALPIGGLREKSLAALRSGITTIIIPEGNKKDVSELPDEVKKSLNIIYMSHADTAIERAIIAE